MRERKITGYYLRVEPIVNRWLGCNETERLHEEESECSRIRSEMRRHVDDCTTRIECEAEYVCSFCGSKWTEGDSPHNGGCCEQDEAVMIATEQEDE